MINMKATRFLSKLKLEFRAFIFKVVAPIISGLYAKKRPLKKGFVQLGLD